MQIIKVACFCVRKHSERKRFQWKKKMTGKINEVCLLWNKYFVHNYFIPCKLTTTHVHGNYRKLK